MTIWHEIYLFVNILTADDPVACGNKALECKINCPIIYVHNRFFLLFLIARKGVCLTHWGRVTHICISDLTIIGSDNGLSSERRQAIIGTNAEVLFIWPLGTNFSGILIAIHIFSFKKMHLKMSSGKWRPSCRGLNVLKCPLSILCQLMVWWHLQIIWTTLSKGCRFYIFNILTADDLEHMDKMHWQTNIFWGVNNCIVCRSFTFSYLKHMRLLKLFRCIIKKDRNTWICIDSE